MSCTVKDIFDMAVYHIDAQNESNGNTETADTNEYKLRTPGLLNSMVDRLYPYSDTYEPIAGKRAVHPKLTSMSDELLIDEPLCRGVLSYWLAAALVLAEGDSAIANSLRSIGDEALMVFMRNMPGGIESVENAYGGLEYGWFSKW